MSIGEGDLTATQSEAKNAVEGILARRFQGTPGGHCADCDFKVICRFCDKNALDSKKSRKMAS